MSRFSFDRTNDVDLIKSVLAHPKIYPHLHDDFAPPRAEWEPTIHPLISYMAVYDRGKLIGMFMVSAHSCVLWEIHEAFLPEAWGRTAAAATVAFREWTWKVSRCQRLFGQIVESNRLALRFALHSGMTVFGRHPRSFMKNGAMLDQIMVGIDRPRGDQ